MRILSAENLRFPGEGNSAQGKSGPKSRLKGVDDGQPVKIPVPSVRCLILRRDVNLMIGSPLVVGV